MLLLFFVLSSLDRAFIKDKTEHLVRDQLLASAQILKTGVERTLAAGAPREGILKGFAGEETVYFLALFDAEDRIVDWTSRFERYLPFSRETARGREAWIIDSPAGKIFNIYIPLTTTTGTSYRLFLGYSLKSMEEMLAFTGRNSFTFFAAMGLAGLILARGISLLHRRSVREAERAVAEKKERERYQAISGFAAGVAHEIKNPLNSLEFYFELVRKKGPGELAEDTALARAEIEKISRIVDQFSDSTRPLSPRKENVFVDAIVRDVLGSVEAEAEARGVSVRFRQNRPIALAADRVLLGQGLLNLVKNSLEATESGTITISARRKAKSVFLLVEDTGRGMTAEDLARAFDPFFSTKTSGMGVGLFLVKKIVEAHGGFVSVSSRPGLGTAVCLEFPGGRA
jgi:signal transduction histidine kinase